MHKLTFEWDYTEVNYAGSHQALSSFLSIAFESEKYVLNTSGHTRERAHNSRTTSSIKSVSDNT